MWYTRRNNRLQKKRHITNPRHQEKGPRGGRRVSGKGRVSVKRQRAFSNYNSKKKKSRVNRTCHNTKQKGGTNPHSTSPAQAVAGQTKYIIITNGPTGSGKSTLKDKAITGLHTRDNVSIPIVDFRKSFKPFLIDDLVEQHPYYKQEISTLLIAKKCADTTCDTKKLETDEGFIQSMNTAYFHTRQNRTCCKANECTLSKVSDESNETGACADGYTLKNSVEYVFDTRIKQSILEGKNIVFETQGLHPVDTVTWMKKMIESSTYDYKIIMAYSLVKYCELIKRNQTRFGSSVTAFLKNTQQQPAPRLPDVQDGEASSFKKTYTLIRDGLLSEPLSSDVTFFIVNNNNNNNTIGSSGNLIAPDDQGMFITDSTKLQAMVNTDMPDKDTTLCESTNVTAKAKL